MASEPGPIVEFLGHVAYHFEMIRPMLPTYLHLLVSAIFPIYAAAHASLARPTSAAPLKAKNTSKDDDDDAESEDQDTPVRLESLNPSDALLFPLLAGCTLASLYFILKWLQDPAWLNWALGLYFSQVGLFFAMKFIKDGLSIIRSFALPNQFSRGGEIWKVSETDKYFKTNTGKITGSPLAGLAGRIPLPQVILMRLWAIRSLLYTKARLRLYIHKLVTFKAPVDVLDVVSIMLSCGSVYYHTFIGKPWFLTNFLGFSFCYGSLQYITPTTAWTGTLVLSALFFYDIYFVFFTPMMVTVATKLDVPIKLLFPQPDGCFLPPGAAEGSEAMNEYMKCVAKKRTMAMLGLGDIVVPGMMLAFALRFDLYLHYLRQGKLENDTKDRAEVYKPTYVSAKGNWGERFWTSSKLWPKQLRAKQFPKTYLYSTIAGYLFGMVVTVVVLQVARHAQPALLYLVPGVLGSLWGTALVKGDLKTLWNYSETPEDEKKDKKTEETLKGETKLPEAREDVVQGDRASAKSEVEEVTTAHKGPIEATKNEVDKDGRRLVYFSITLPNRPGETGSTVAGVSPSSTNGATPSAALQDSNANGSADRATLSRDDGEPPEKRARRS